MTQVAESDGRKRRRSDSESNSCFYSDLGTTLVCNTGAFQTARKHGRPLTPDPVPRKQIRTSPIIDLAGEEFCTAEIDVESFKVSQERKDELITSDSAQKLCVGFFEGFGMTVLPQIRTEGKRRFCRLSINSGEFVFEESLDTSLLGRIIASLKAVRAFNPDLVSTWLQRHKKIHTLTKGCLI